MESTVIRIGGAAGDGVQSAGLILAKAFSRNGLYVSTYNYYQSLIRGGESWYQIRTSEEVVKNQGSGLDVLIALNEDALNRHTDKNINEGGASPLTGIAIFDGEMITDYKKNPDVKYCPVPLRDIALKYDKNSLLKNTVALGAAMAALGLKFDGFAGVINEVFSKKGKIADLNVKVAKEGYDYFMDTYGIYKKLNSIDRKLYIATGGETVGLGAVNAGMQMYFAYPMTPASSALHFFANHAKKYNLFVKVTEDEISAINAAIGANYAGVRAMTGTSGGGFALMTEAVGLSGMTEVPLVVYESQRPGPSTGLPTKTEQGDLNQILGAGQGDFPRIVLAPGNVTDAFNLAKEAFNLAEEYQLPVFIMSDLYLSEHVETLLDVDLNYKMDHGLRANNNEKDFKRYEFTESGISKRAIPGQKGLMHNEDSDEHDEYGNVVSDEITDPKIRILSMEKRMRKLEAYIKNMPPTKTYKANGAENLIIQWGSTKGAVEEVVDDLNNEGYSVGALEIDHVYPLNPDIAEYLKNRPRIIVVENNFSGHLNKLLKSEFLINTDFIGKYDGEAFYPEDLKAKIKGLLNVRYENVKIGGKK